MNQDLERRVINELVFKLLNEYRELLESGGVKQFYKENKKLSHTDICKLRQDMIDKALEYMHENDLQK
jgi:coenzyme F420-reducing hydrogenase gamma subunit